MADSKSDLRQNKSMGSLLVGIAGGVAIGTAATMYFADEKRRKQMQKKFQELSGSVKNNVSNLKNNTMQLEDNVMKKTGDAIDTLQKKSNDMMDKEKDMVDQADHAAKKIADKRAVH